LGSLSGQGQHQPSMGSWAASAVQGAQAGAAASPAVPDVPQPVQGSSQQAWQQSLVESGQRPNPQAERGDDEQAVHPLLVPVSALAAGLAPNRAGTTPSGSGEGCSGWGIVFTAMLTFQLVSDLNAATPFSNVYLLWVSGDRHAVTTAPWCSWAGHRKPCCMKGIVYNDRSIFGFSNRRDHAGCAS
jgi:hypothetical protein